MINKKPCLKIAQTLLLQATYFEASARHLSFWSLTRAASFECTSVTKSQRMDWTFSYGDLVKRAHWISVLQKRLFDLEFRAFLTGTEDPEDQVSSPHFCGMARKRRTVQQAQPDNSRVSTVNQHEDSTFHPIAMITLRCLISKADGIIRSHEPNTGETEVLWQGSDIKTLVDTSA